MSKERAHRRAERERVAAEVAAERSAEAERRARRTARRSTLTGWIPRPAAQPSGALAAQRRQQTGLLVALVVAVNVLTWLGTESWAPRAFVALLSVLVGPIAVSLLNRK